VIPVDVKGTPSAGSDPLRSSKLNTDNMINIYRHPLVQSLLDQIPQPMIKTPIEINFPIAKSFVDKDTYIIAGYASVEVIDSQKELIPIPVIKEAWEQFRKNKDFYFGSLMHSNIPIIKVLDEYTDSEGQVWKSGVDENGLFIVAAVRQDIEKGKQSWELIKQGKLTGFSIGGEALASHTVCEGKCYTRVDKMELHEIAVVDRPANAPSVFKILKGEKFKRRVDAINEVLSSESLSVQLIEKIMGEAFRETFGKLDKALNILSKKVVRRGNKWCVVHCTGPKAGQAIKCFPTKEQADRMHAAIMTNKMEKQKPPKVEWDRCETRASGLEGINDPAAFCGNMWYNDRSRWNTFVKVEKKGCNCPVDKTITEASRNKLDKALIKLTSGRSNIIKKEK